MSSWRRKPKRVSDQERDHAIAMRRRTRQQLNRLTAELAAEAQAREALQAELLAEKAERQRLQASIDATKKGVPT